MSKEHICRKCKHCIFLSWGAMDGIPYTNCDTCGNDWGTSFSGYREECEDFELPDFDENCWDENDCFKSVSLWKLRKQVSIGSLYLHDFENSFGINPDYLCNFFEEYAIWLEDTNRKDNEENLKEFYDDEWLDFITKEQIIKDPRK